MSSKVAEIVTQKITDALAKGIVPWHKPWHSSGMENQNLFTKREYNGVNRWLTGMECHASPYWGTFKQIQEHGGKVRKGEKGTMIIFWTFLKPKDPDEKKLIPMLRYYTVFNSEQADGLEKFIPVEEPKEPREYGDYSNADSIVKEYLDRTKIPVRHGGDRACYIPSMDVVNMPEKDCFKETEAYYGTLFHELVHSTGHSSRLDRDTIKKISNWGDHSYSREELVAEMGSCMMMAEADMEPDYDQSAAYIHGWSDSLKSDPLMIITASSRAEKARAFILHGAIEEEGEQDDN